LICPHCNGEMTGGLCPTCAEQSAHTTRTTSLPPDDNIVLLVCRACGNHVSSFAAACPRCGHPIASISNRPQSFEPVAVVNDSGTGPSAVLPVELRGFNWGACLIGVIWGLFHNSWIAVLAVVPYVGVVASLISGYKGNEWAWQNRKWESIEQFKRVQAQWAIAGFIVTALMIVPLAIIVLAMVPTILKEVQDLSQ